MKCFWFSSTFFFHLPLTLTISCSFLISHRYLSPNSNRTLTMRRIYYILARHNMLRFYFCSSCHCVQMGIVANWLGVAVSLPVSVTVCVCVVSHRPATIPFCMSILFNVAQVHSHIVVLATPLSSIVRWVSASLSVYYCSWSFAPVSCLGNSWFSICLA